MDDQVNRQKSVVWMYSNLTSLAITRVEYSVYGMY